MPVSLAIAGGAARVHAQDLAPRAYVVTPLGSNATTLSNAYNDGDLLIEGAVGTFDGKVLGEQTSIDRSGLFDSVVRVSVNLGLWSTPVAAIAQDAGEHTPADVTKAFPNKAPYSPLRRAKLPAFGAKLGPADAFHFARGEEVSSNSGQPVKLSRPLDSLDVAWSGDRKRDPKTGKVPSVGSSVDVPNATWTNSIGAPELIAVWKEPGFDPAQRAFYYARVIEIPTPRWTACDVKRFGNEPLPGTRMTITERAYTSPIWHTPN